MYMSQYLFFLKGEQAPVDITIYIGSYRKTIFTK